MNPIVIVIPPSKYIYSCHDDNNSLSLFEFFDAINHFVLYLNFPALKHSSEWMVKLKQEAR